MFTARKTNNKRPSLRSGVKWENEKSFSEEKWQYALLSLRLLPLAGGAGAAMSAPLWLSKRVAVRTLLRIVFAGDQRFVRSLFSKRRDYITPPALQ
jgi:hypothetical protein